MALHIKVRSKNYDTSENHVLPLSLVLVLFSCILCVLQFKICECTQFFRSYSCPTTRQHNILLRVKDLNQGNPCLNPSTAPHLLSDLSSSLLSHICSFTLSTIERKVVFT